MGVQKRTKIVRIRTINLIFFHYICSMREKENMYLFKAMFASNGCTDSSPQYRKTYY